MLQNIICVTIIMQSVLLIYKRINKEIKLTENLKKMKRIQKSDIV